MRETSLPQKTEHNELNKATEALNPPPSLSTFHFSAGVRSAKVLLDLSVQRLVIADHKL